MAKAGFKKVFIGIETPNEDSLTECTKYLNKNRNLIACVKKIQNIGLVKKEDRLLLETYFLDIAKTSPLLQLSDIICHLWL